MARPDIYVGFYQIPLLQKLDYENPNERKFLLLVIATEEKTAARLSSTATVTVEVVDMNDNHPVFPRESYTADISESAIGGENVGPLLLALIIISKQLVLHNLLA